jgi:hypothetical protein
MINTLFTFNLGQNRRNEQRIANKKLIRHEGKKTRYAISNKRKYDAKIHDLEAYVHQYGGNSIF